MIKPVLFAALVCVCADPVGSSAQEAKITIDMMGIGDMSAHWQSTQAGLKAASVGGLCFIVPIEMRVPARQSNGDDWELWQRDRRIARLDTKTYGGGWHRGWHHRRRW